METVQENNVIDIRSGQTVLPNKLRSIIKGQFLESSDQKQDPEQFMILLEQRLLSEVARTTINFTKNWLEGIK